ncbi:MAG TPA: hypothetical protein VMY78_13440 [Solirubrobacteraceae bacterium]|nr:hypothetical protein [Solirubrobacteraceae bacterium]
MGEALRRIADRIDPPRAAPSGEDLLVSREELRTIQETGVQMMDDWIYVSRMSGRDDGLLWMPREILASIQWLIDMELEVRDSDYAAIEKDPAVVLR